MTISAGERNKMLDALTGRTTYTATPVYAQLHTADPGANGTANVATEADRVQVTFGAAAAAGSIASTAETVWAGVAADETYSHVTYWSASSDGDFKGSDDITDAGMLTGQTFRVTTLTVSVSGTVAEGERNKMLDAWAGRADYTANAAVYVKLHLGDPGAAGANNAAAETTRIQATFGDAAAAGSIDNSAASDWPDYPATETPSHISLWTANAAGTWLGNDQLAASVAMTGSNSETFRIAAGALILALGVTLATQSGDTLGDFTLDIPAADSATLDAGNHVLTISVQLSGAPVPQVVIDRHKLTVVDV